MTSVTRNVCEVRRKPRREKARAEDQHLDVDVEVRALKTCRVDNFTGDVAATAPEQIQTEEKSMNSVASIVHSSNASGSEDLNDVEIVKLRITLE